MDDTPPPTGKAPATPQQLRVRAMELLTRREYSRAELERKLAVVAESPQAVATLLDEFQQRGWLSEQRAASEVIHARRGRYGSRAIVQKLRERGVDEAVVEQAKGELKSGDLNAARAVWKRRFGTLPATPKEHARQYRFLLGRGFEPEVIGRVLKESDEG